MKTNSNRNARKLIQLWIVVKGYTSTCFLRALRYRQFFQHFLRAFTTSAAVTGG